MTSPPSAPRQSQLLSFLPSSLPYLSLLSLPLPEPLSPDPACPISLLSLAVPLLSLLSLPLSPESLSDLRSFIHTLISRIHFTPCTFNLPYSDPSISSIPEDIDTLLAQFAASSTAHFASVWNQMTPEKFHITDPDLSAEQIKQLRVATKRLADEGLELELQLRITRSAAIDQWRAAVENAVDSVEVDLSERAERHNSDAVHLEMLARRGGATGAKLRLQGASLAAETYTESSVKALKKLASKIAERKTVVNAEIQRGQKRLNEIEVCGDEFENVVDRISTLQKVLEQKKWEKEQLLGCASKPV